MKDNIHTADVDFAWTLQHSGAFHHNGNQVFGSRSTRSVNRSPRYKTNDVLIGWESRTWSQILICPLVKYWMLHGCAYQNPQQRDNSANY